MKSTDLNLLQRTVLITGSSRGIGKAIAESLLSCGQYRIFTPGRDEMNLEDTNSIDKYLDKIPGVDILINNAGINILADISDINDDSINQMVQVNLEAPLRLIRGVSVHMKRNCFGRIINISSIWGVRSKEKRAVYSMTKFGINGITKAVARDLGEFGILVNSVCPGYTNTELTQKNVSPDEQELIKRTIPLKRFAEPFEIAEFIKFLISDKNSYITGQTLVIDGGFLS
jgi:3-oxoacyl-[acyl-carrier protein] reductase